MRLVNDWDLPDAPQMAFATEEMDLVAPSRSGRIEFDWAGESARITGTIVHRWLQRIGEQGLDHWTVSRIAEHRTSIEMAMRSMGLPESRLPEAVDRTLRALQATLRDERGKWLLGQKHAGAWCELALTGVLDGSPVSVVMDRVILDADKVLWIVDYKSGQHEGAGQEEFLDRERERYREQMSRYAAIARLWRPGIPVRTALYFPLMSAWCELD